MKPSGVGVIGSMNFHMVLFWIHILNVPLVCMNKSYARFWGNLIIGLERVEIHSASMRVQVKFYIEKPLSRGL